ncbi:regulatory iron-sulfur-containing complex subunit RicT [Aequorivita sp. SDUM287046]|uniref:Regulatory iron-sulfur-containing complex subunit RicT n=1 Tax=Aequorivita aurantiaca TaxID=3053356 RepID=A0ABT8DDD0_9FLAO|nr:regulatory iron-sulfur-containing complex subunit RicT [Aequorivita aurantiaca]MDN3723227.1 regulatory iron-sulfur-containing complex subunit RicT [Aequorivita aurantiaca]
MGCTSCATGANGQPKGCKNNGTCGTDGCNKLTVFDWLSNMQLPANMEPFNAVEVRFKNGRKEFFQNPENLTLSIGDIIATEASPGHDIGIITLTGELVRVQMKKKKVPLKVESLPKIYRKASQKDIDIWQGVRDREADVQKRSREIAIRLGLQMKISDVEFQGDASKVIFYYTAEDRVDFRELIKEFARTFNTRIEMKQVGFRQEAARLGGIGSCGRELCCSTWLTDFRSVNTSAARYQQLSLNPQKLAGQCGKLKCCLNYELDTYLEALESFPNTETKLQTEKGNATCQKIDIFKGLLWYAYEKEFMNWHQLTAEKANEIIELNKKGIKPTALEEYTPEIPKQEKEPYSNVVGQDSLTRFDQPKNKGIKRRNKSRNKNKNTAVATADNPAKNNPKHKQSKKSGNRPRKKPTNQNRNSKPPKNE